MYATERGTEGQMRVGPHNTIDKTNLIASDIGMQILNCRVMPYRSLF